MLLVVQDSEASATRRQCLAALTSEHPLNLCFPDQQHAISLGFLEYLRALLGVHLLV